jgi:hypothetical protein
MYLLKILLADRLRIAVTSDTTMKVYSSEYFQACGTKGGKATQAKYTPEERKERARALAQARWAKKAAKTSGVAK